MKYLILLLSLMFTTMAVADEESDNDDVAQQHGYSKKELKKLRKEKAKRIDGEAIAQEIAKSFETDSFQAAKYTDQAIENMIQASKVVLTSYGYEDEANAISLEYNLKYKNYAVRQMLGDKELGDFPPMSEFLTKVHNKIEDLIGEFLCKMFHLHDLMIINYSMPVVFAPSKYDLENYIDHSAGHKFGWFWIHHGFYGVVTYWIVNWTCGGFTAGMGIITFICGPISGFAESAMDSYIAPPVSEAIWKRFNQ